MENYIATTVDGTTWAIEDCWSRAEAVTRADAAGLVIDSITLAPRDDITYALLDECFDAGRVA